MNQKPKTPTASQVASVVSIPGYKIKDVLGKGGMAIVYLAVQESIGREVALKVLVPDHTDETFSERFLSEARIISSLNHPHIVTVYDAGVHQGCHYMTMEYVPGKSLRDARDLLSRKQKVQIIKQVAQALDYAGKKGYVHRDIKPENILLHEDGRAILTDFGIARSLNVTHGLTVTGKTIGTPYYMSPEQTKGTKVDHRSDIYSLGVVLFQALAGYLPYDGPSLVAIGIKHISEPIPDLPVGLEIFQPIIDKTMAKEPAQRYASAGDFYNALEAISEADLDYIDAKVAAIKKKGIDYQAKTMLESTPQQSVSKKSPDEKIRIRATRTTPPRPLDVTHTDDFKRLRRRRRWLFFLIIIALLGGTAYYQQAELLDVWQEHLEPRVAQWRDKLQSTEDTTTPPQPTAGAQTNDTSAAPAAPTTEQTQPHTVVAQADSLQHINTHPDTIAKLVDSYHATLSVNPNDADALQGLADASKWYLLQIRTAIDEHNTTQARTLLLQARKNLTPAYVPAQLLVIEEQLLRKEAIQAHMDKAKRYFSQGKLISSESENARDEWLAVLSIDPQHAEARQGIESISQYYLRQATAQHKAGKYIEALAATESGLSANREHRALLELKARVEKEIEKQNRILSLLIQAEADMQAGKVISPPDENAFDRYQQVLREQPGNKKAGDGLQKIEDYLNRQINTAIWENKLTQANMLLNEALRRYPNSVKLDQSKAKLAGAIQSRAPRVTHILFSNVVLTSLLQEQGAITPANTLYIGFTYTNLTNSTTLLKAKLWEPNNRLIEKKLIVSDKSGEHIFTIEHPQQKFLPGTYRFIIELDTTIMLDTTFTIVADDPAAPLGG